VSARWKNLHSAACMRIELPRYSLTHACMISIKGRRNDNVTSKVAHPRAVWNYFCALATRQQNYTLRWREQENTSIPNCSPTLLLTSERYVGTGWSGKKFISPQLQGRPLARSLDGPFICRATHIFHLLWYLRRWQLVSLASIQPESGLAFPNFVHRVIFPRYIA
jgi:hypothetical protein